MSDAATAWTTAYLADRVALQAYAFALTGRADAAADLLQDVLLRLIAKGQPPVEDPKAYLLRALRNLAIDRFRGRRAPDSPLDEDVLAPIDPDPIASAEQLDALRTALGQLPAVQREVIVLKTHCGMTHAEIAEIMQLPPGTVASHHHRGLEQLRDLLTEDDGDPRTTGAVADRPADPPASR